ncbi:MAG: hypothetical protein RIE73_05795 [Coleofasciculus sp. C1-SOL-03]
MNRLFIHLYLDEDVNVLIADFVRAKGFDGLYCQDYTSTLKRCLK